MFKYTLGYEIGDPEIFSDVELDFENKEIKKKLQEVKSKLDQWHLGADLFLIHNGKIRAYPSYTGNLKLFENNTKTYFEVEFLIEKETL